MFYQIYKTRERSWSVVYLHDKAWIASVLNGLKTTHLMSSLTK
jgi:hypothetical protein